MHKFVELMSSQRNAVIIKLAAFVHIRLQRENIYHNYIFVLLPLAYTHHIYCILS